MNELEGAVVKHLTEASNIKQDCGNLTPLLSCNRDLCPRHFKRERLTSQVTAGAGDLFELGGNTCAWWRSQVTRRMVLRGT